MLFCVWLRERRRRENGNLKRFRLSVNKFSIIFFERMCRNRPTHCCNKIIAIREKLNVRGV